MVLGRPRAREWRDERTASVPVAGRCNDLEDWSGSMSMRVVECNVCGETELDEIAAGHVHIIGP